MDALTALHNSVEKIVLNPQYHDILVLVKAIRNGIVYGTKVRFPHALVMVFLFRSGTFRSKLGFILKATRQHARNLGLFALIYKATMLLLRKLSHKEQPYDSFIAGLLGGYYVFGRSRSSVNQQIVMYVFARVVLAFSKLAMTPRADGGAVAVAGDVYGHGATGARGGGWGLIADDRLAKTVRRNSWPVFASLSWALVMWVFRWHPESVQPSLRSSMHYIYENADQWDSLQTLIWHNN